MILLTLEELVEKGVMPYPTFSRRNNFVEVSNISMKYKMCGMSIAQFISNDPSKVLIDSILVIPTSEGIRYCLDKEQKELFKTDVLENNIDRKDRYERSQFYAKLWGGVPDES